LGIIFVSPTVYLLSVIWEVGSLRKKVKSVYFNFITAFIIYIICISSSYLIQGVWPNPWGFYPKAGIGEGPYLIWFYTLMVLSFRNFIRSYRKEKIAIKKKQTKLVIIAFIFGFMGSLDYLGNFGIPLYPFGAVIVIFFSTTIAYTIINYKLMEIETVIHRTIAWFFTSAALAAPLAVLFYFTRTWHNKLTPVGAWSYFGAAFLFFLFFVKTFQPKVDNFFQKGKVYLEGVLSKFADELVHLRSLEELVSKIKDTIANTLHVSNVTVLLQLDSTNPFLRWLSKNDRVLDRKFIEIDPSYEPIRTQAKDYFQKSNAVVCIPLILNKRLIGIINVGQKTNLKPFRASDLHFLTRIKNQSTIAISNSLAYDRVEEMVKVRTEELIETQQQLVQAEKLATIGTLAGGVAHEINNPLAAVMTNAQMLKDSKLNEEDKESVDLIEEAARRCRAIIQKLMLYSRKPMGRREVAEVDLEVVLKNVIAFLGYQLKQENVRIAVKKDKPPFITSGNQNELEQVLTNLIINARDATKAVKKHGEVHVALSREDSRITIRVTDEGKGIAKEDLQRIFDPFFTTKEVGKGTGLGLSICHSIVEQHQGSIRAESDGKNGSAFIITLPEYERTTAGTRT